MYDLLSNRCFNVDDLDFMLTMDQSRGHPNMREGTLNTNNMSVRYGGRQGILRETKIRYIGTYPEKLDIDNSQSMVFLEEEDGPFYLPP